MQLAGFLNMGYKQCIHYKLVHTFSNDYQCAARLLDVVCGLLVNA